MLNFVLFLIWLTGCFIFGRTIYIMMNRHDKIPIYGLRRGVVIRYDNSICVWVSRRFPGVKYWFPDDKRISVAMPLGQAVVDAYQRRVVPKNVLKDLFLTAGEFFFMDWRWMLPMRERYWRGYNKRAIATFEEELRMDSKTAYRMRKVWYLRNGCYRNRKVIRL